MYLHCKKTKLRTVEIKQKSEKVRGMKYINVQINKITVRYELKDETVNNCNLI